MDRKRKRQSGVELWTASKCLRLLRPIASRIAPLKRHQYTISESSQKPIETLVLDCDQVRNVQARGKFSENHANSVDPTWLPGQVRQRQLKRYTSHSRSSQPPAKHPASPQTCLVSLPTPFKARVLRRGTPLKQGSTNFAALNSPCVSRDLPVAKSGRQRKDPFTRAPIAKQSVELQSRENYERIFELHQGVTDGFSLLLQRTAPKDSEPRAKKGVPSLLEMCLRRVPDYIKAEEEWRKSIDEDDDTDVASEVYEELESLGPVQGRGWPGLREVVIAHGIDLVRGIIRDKLVSTDTRAELSKMPALYGLQRASEDLYLTFAHSLPLKRPLNVGSRLFDGCLIGLTNIESPNADNDVFVRVLDDLFSSGRLRSSWLATRDVVNLSSRMIRTLASRSGNCQSTVDFLEGRISQTLRSEMAGRGTARIGPEDHLEALTKLERSLSNTTVSIITVLTAIVLIDRDDEGLTHSIAAECLLTRLAVRLLADLGSFDKTKPDGHLTEANQQHNICFALLTSNLILRVRKTKANSCHVSLQKEDILQGMCLLHDRDTAEHRSAQTMIERAASFVSDLSRCCGQSLHSDGQDYLEDLVHSILEASDHGSSHEVTLLKQFALESSLHFARISATRRSQAFMDNIETALTQQRSSNAQPPAIKTSRDLGSAIVPKLRWEEGLCEWIVASPLPTTNSRKSVVTASKTNSLNPSSDHSDLDDSGYLSSTQETPFPRVKHSVNISCVLASPDVLGFDSSPHLDLSTQIHHLNKARYEMLTPLESSPIKQANNVTQDVVVVLRSKDVDAVPAANQDHVNLVSLKENVCSTVTTTEGLGIRTPERPRKKRKSRAASPRKPEALSFAQVSTWRRQDTAQGSAKEAVHDFSDNEVDELAMSCVKPRRPAVAVRKTARDKMSRKVMTTKSSRGDCVDSSGDELGL